MFNSPVTALNNNNNSLNQGAVAIEQSRAVTEAQGKLLLAKQFPRDENQAFNQLMNSCRRKSFAQVALYSFPRGGQTVAGPSIRLAEEIARVYMNIEFGIRELSNNNGESEMEAYAWDLQNNVVSSQKFKVKHLRDKRGGATKLTDQRDIYEITANMGARRLRSRLLAILPPDMVELAVEECRKTMAGVNDAPISDRIRQMTVAFAKYSVTTEMIEKRLQHDIDTIDNDELVDLLGIYNSIKNGQSKRDEWFEVKREIEVKAKPQAVFKPLEQKQPEKQEEPKEQSKKELDSEGF